MWFKNLYVFAFTRPFELSEEKLTEHLSEHLFTPCGSTEMSHFGWTDALGKHGNGPLHYSDGNFLVCARKETKLLPGQVITDAVDEKVAALESEQARSATKKEREQFKEDVIFELLPRAFSRVVDTHAYINPANNTIVVNASSRGVAEDILALLRKCLGTLPVTSLSPEIAPDEVMTEWLVEKNLDASFQLGMEATFKGLGDDAPVVTVKNLELESEEVKIHLDTDKSVVKLSLEFDESISFVLTDDLSIKRLKFFDVIKEQNDDIDSDDIVAKLDADFTLMAGELNRLITNVYSLFNVKASDYLEED
jgi:recombination associated protein RdgC